MWSLADSSNGYICCINIYCGHRAHPSTNGLRYDVVANLMDDHLDKQHHCYFDNFFTSVKLLDDLLAANTYACGTVRANQAGLPVQFKKPGRMKRGESIKMQRDAMVAVMWHDKRDVRIISTNSQPTDEIVKRRTRHILTDVPCPSVIMNYNKNMGVVDLAHQLRSYYEIGRNAKKYWKCLMFYLLNICVVNSYIIYKETLLANEKRPHTHIFSTGKS